jgi:hypothetical protein
MDNTTQGVVIQALSLLVRHGLTTLAGLLVGWGALAPAQSANFVDIGVGVAVFLVGYLWSFYISHAKFKKIDNLQTNVNTLEDHVTVLKDQLPKSKGGNK